MINFDYYLMWQFPSYIFYHILFLILFCIAVGFFIGYVWVKFDRHINVFWLKGFKMNQSDSLTFEQFAKDQPEWLKLHGIQRRVIAAISRNRKVLFAFGRRPSLKEVYRLQHKYLTQVKK